MSSFLKAKPPTKALSPRVVEVLVSSSVEPLVLLTLKLPLSTFKSPVIVPPSAVTVPVTSMPVEVVASFGALSW